MSMQELTNLSLDSEALHFLPLGGTCEIGMNANLYGIHKKWLMIDLGIAFSGHEFPGVDIVVPDITFAESLMKNLLGILITHAHEDHLGAVARLWPKLRCKLYAMPFAANILREKLAEVGLSKIAKITEVTTSSSFNLGPFNIEYVSVTHSIPEANSIILDTPVGTILHTGDWKLDQEPLVGPLTDIDRLRRCGSDGILAMMCDSTNIMSSGRSGSEALVRNKLVDIVSGCKNGVAVTQFASNVARLQSVVFAAHKNKRDIVLIGRSLWKYVKAAQTTGYLNKELKFLTEKEASRCDSRRLLYLCTGCQGELKAGLTKIVSQSAPKITLKTGDCVIFSSKIIPGNERAIGNLQAKLRSRNIKVISEENCSDIHVTGHPKQDELKELYGWVKPEIAVPVHGEQRHIQAHAAFAKEQGVKKAFMLVNGDVLRLGPGLPEVVGSVSAGSKAVDGDRLISPNHISFSARRKLMASGAIFVSLVCGENGALVAQPIITGDGILDSPEEAEHLKNLVRLIEKKFTDDGVLGNNEQLCEMTRLIIRRSVMRLLSKRPVIKVHLTRV